MTELRECPFCGSDAFFSPKMDDGHAIVFCKGRCRANPMVYADTDEEAIEIWNTRFEPTCRIRQSGSATGFCSRCGAEFIGSIVNNEPPDYVESVHHCPNCGAKVANECTMSRVYLYDEETVDGIECPECGWSGIHDHDNPLPDECPNCKAKVIEE